MLNENVTAFDLEVIYFAEQDTISNDFYLIPEMTLILIGNGFDLNRR